MHRKVGCAGERQFELAGDFDGHCRALEVLLVGSQEQDQDVGENEGEQRFLIEAWMRVDEEVIELKAHVAHYQVVLEE